ncbi:MAG TPA: nucleoside triphosphate pyrophosphohydrolase, partial [Terriglobia bacterium]|nr:nucleoside triphosphate pyrophosphohydrolase [Terriglobia bacterium]
EEEVGDLMFAVANLTRLVRSDPESCLRGANQKFRRRFQALEAEVKRRGKSVRTCTPRELDDIWEWVKAQEKE